MKRQRNVDQFDFLLPFAVASALVLVAFLRRRVEFGLCVNIRS